MEKHIAVIPGDGIGPEIVKEAVKVLDVIAKKYGHSFVYTEVDAGGCAIDNYGTSLPKESLDAALASDSVLLGCRRTEVGSCRSFYPSGKSIVKYSQGLGLYANLVLQKSLRSYPMPLHCVGISSQTELILWSFGN